MDTNLSEPYERMEEFKNAARNAGIKLTHQRLEIFREVASREDHPDAETIYRALNHRLPTMSIDTVYRTLWMLNDLGLIDTLWVRQKSQRFDANIHPHHHFVCVRCGMTRDFENSEYNGLPVPDQALRFGRVLESRVEVRGICSECLKNEAREGS